MRALLLACALLTAACGPDARDVAITKAKKTILGIGLEKHAAEQSWKAADAVKQEDIRESTSDPVEYKAKIGLWRAKVQNAVNKAFAVFDTAIIAAMSTLYLVESGLKSGLDLITVAKEIWAAFQQLRMTLQAFDITVELPGGF